MPRGLAATIAMNYLRTEIPVHAMQITHGCQSFFARRIAQELYCIAAK
jgi:hypothetical protein